MKFLRLGLVACVVVWLCSPAARAQVLHSLDFENFTAGSGNLATTTNTADVTLYVYGNTPFGTAYTDPIQGILASSPLGTGAAAYLGGAGTNLPLSNSGTLIALFFSGAANAPVVNLIGSAKPVKTASVDFVVQRNSGTNAQAFSFSLYDAVDPSDASTFAYHSMVKVNADNTVSIADNNFTYIPTGVTVQPGVAYNLSVTADYNRATWSAVLTQLTTSVQQVLANKRSINTGGFTLSGWTTPESLDIEMDATTSTADHALADRLIFDNVICSTRPDPLLHTLDFETSTAGPGNLATTANTDDVTLYVYGNTPFGTAYNDPIQGILPTSPLTTGQAAYLGGAGTNLPLTGSGTLTALFFSGAANSPVVKTPVVNMTVSSTPVITDSLNFMLQRNSGTNAQSFSFFRYDAVDPENANTFAYHSMVKINADNTVSIADNNYTYVPTGVTLLPGLSYDLTITTDYQHATWSAVITREGGSTQYVLATNRSINTGGYTLSGWTTPESLDIEMDANVSSGDHALADRMIFDHVVTSVAPPTPQYAFTTLAGTPPGYTDGTGSAARFNNPQHVATDSAGNLYVSDTNNNVIRKVTPAGVVTTLAGLAGSAGTADGTGSAARFSGPTGIAVDSAGYVYVSSNDAIRKISPAGVVTTLAGGVYGAADGTGTAAQFENPQGLAVDSSGNVFVADLNNMEIRQVTPAGVVTTLAGSHEINAEADGTGSAARFSGPWGITIDGNGVLYVTDSYAGNIRVVTPAGVVTTLAGTGNNGYADGTGSAASFSRPTGIALDATGNLYVDDTDNDAIRFVTPAGVVTTLAGQVGLPGSADGTGSAAAFNGPAGIAVGAAGNLYAADANNCTIRAVTPAGVVTTFAGVPEISGADGTGGAAGFAFPSSVAVDAAGNAYVADAGNSTIRKITPAGAVTTLAGLAGVQGNADGTGSAARFAYPQSIAVDASGNVYVGDSHNFSIRVITPAGVVTTLAGGSSGSADGTGSAAQFSYGIFGLAVDGAGNVYASDVYNNAIRKVTPAGVVTTFAGTVGSWGYVDATGTAAKFTFPGGLGFDQAGNLYVMDLYNFAIRKITPAGVVSTFAGGGYGNPDGGYGNADGVGTGAQFESAQGLAVDAAGTVYVADTVSNTIRYILPNGTVMTIGGVSGIQGSADGTGGAAQFSLPQSIAAGPGGKIYIADTSNNTIRVGTPVPPVAAFTFPASAAVIGGTITFDAAGSSDSNPDASITSYSWNFGDSSGTATGLNPTHAYTSAGTYTVTLTVTDSAGATGIFTTSVVVSKAAQNITFGSLANHTFGDAPFTVTATASSGLTPTFSIVSGPATISGHTVTLTGTGTVVVRASQAGNANYNAAPNVDQSFNVSSVVAFFGIGDLAGGVNFSEVRDVTQVNGVLYAVGQSSANPGSTGADTAVLWTSSGGLTALPNLVANTTATSPIIASAITPDAAYIASRARADSASQRHAVRVTTNGLVNLDLGTLPGYPQYSAASAISADGSILYGFARYNSNGQNQAVRFTASGPSVATIPFLNAGDNSSSPAALACSSDGSVMVGTSSNTTVSGGNLYAPGNTAFRYVQGSGVSAIPYLPGGTWSQGLALSPDGNLALVTGDSTTAPSGEVYLYNAATTAITALGTPNGNWNSNNFAGMNADGSVVVDYFNDGTIGVSYVRNSTGWHAFEPLLTQAGITFAGWSQLQVLGLSADAALVWGSGQHNGSTEGFVVRLAPGYLAAATGGTSPNHPANDFNGDGQSDIVWQNMTTGDRGFWLMNGTSYASWVDLGGVSIDWRIAATADYNGDGQPDFLWENTVTGDRGFWLMNGTTFSSWVDLGAVSTDWRVVGAGDFNGDGKPDILWENTVTGDRGFWLMNGTTFSSWVDLGYISTDWRIAATADFNGDGKPDILWENTVTGDHGFWLMNGTSYASWVDLGVVSTDWHVAAVSDFNGDGEPDILWENTNTGDRGFWLMNGTAFGSWVDLGYVSTDWQIAP